MLGPKTPNLITFAGKLPSMLIDTHAHLYATQFDTDRHATLHRAIEAGVQKMVLPNIDQRSIEPMWQLVADFPDHCFAAIGLHPCDVAADFEHQKRFLEHELAQRPYVAIGETGIDLYWDKSTLAQQLQAFAWHIEVAKETGLPIIVHARDAFDEIFELLAPRQDGRLRGVFHCFTGTEVEAQRVVDLGMMLGIGGVLTFKNSGLAQAIAHVPLSALLLETDAPYLAPHPHRGKRNESAYLPLVAQQLAKTRQMDLQSLAAQTTHNAQQLFGI